MFSRAEKAKKCSPAHFCRVCDLIHRRIEAALKYMPSGRGENVVDDRLAFDVGKGLRGRRQDK
jgi:hypothetical protein